MVDTICLYMQLWPSSRGKVYISNNLLFCIYTNNTESFIVLFEYIDKPMVLTNKVPPRFCSGHHFEIELHLIKNKVNMACHANNHAIVTLKIFF